jgi:hypothetical protein
MLQLMDVSDGDNGSLGAQQCGRLGTADGERGLDDGDSACCVAHWVGPTSMIPGISIAASEGRNKQIQKLGCRW